MFPPRLLRTSAGWSRLLLLLTVSLFPRITTAQDASLQGLQSVGGAAAYSFVPTGSYHQPPEDSTSSSSSLLYLTGYNPTTQDCYLTQLEVTVSTGSYTVRQQIVLPQAGTCTALAHVADHFVVTGYTTTSATQTTADFQIRVYDTAFVSTATTTTMHNTTVFDDAGSTAVYPIALVVDSSDSSGQERSFSLALDTSSANPNPVLDYAATDYQLALRSVTYGPGPSAGSTMMQMYRFSYGTTRDGQAVPLIPADLLLLSSTNQLIVVGTTYTTVFGEYTTTDPIADASKDGFVLQLDASATSTLSQEEFESAPRARLASSNAQDDVVHSACSDDDNDYLYVVGTTAGVMNGATAALANDTTPQPQAFVAKPRPQL